MGLNFPLKLGETRLWMCSKVWTLGILIESTLQNTLIIKHIETLNFGGLFFLPLGFLQQEILNVKKVTMLLPKLPVSDTCSNPDDTENRFLSATSFCVHS